MLRWSIVCCAHRKTHAVSRNSRGIVKTIPIEKMERSAIEIVVLNSYWIQFNFIKRCGSVKLYGDLLGYLTKVYKERKAKKEEELKKKEEMTVLLAEGSSTGPEETAGSAAEESEGEKTEDPRLADPEYQALMNTDLYYLRLKFFTYYTLDKAGFKTVGDVCHPKTDKDIYRLKYLRKKIKKELTEKLKKYDDRLEIGA